MAGRPPKPTHLKILHGDRSDRINDDEPVPAQIDVEPPFSLTESAAEAWNRLAPDRIAKGVLTPWDVDAFAEFCEALVILRGKRECANALAVPGAPSPMAEYKTAISIVATLGARFGWTPSDRAKLTTERTEDPKGAERLLS